MKPFDVVIRGSSQVLTCTGDVSLPAEQVLAPIERGAVGLADGKVAWLGPEASLPQSAVGTSTHIIDAQGGFVGPGLVDCHTHVVFAGDRSEEFEQRCQGKSYLEIAQAGGGILKTVRATRAASLDELVALALPRLQRLREFGVTTAEVKSGYGLDVESELKMLRAIGVLAAKQPVTLVPTLLALHALPPEFAQARAGWISLACRELLPAVAREGLARFCDAFVEQSAFTADEAKTVLDVARGLGLLPRLHVEQLTAGTGAQLAASVKSISADHLEQLTPEGIATLKASGTVAVLAPTSTLFARVKPYAPGRALRDAGVPVALCTNCNPGSSNSENVSLAMGLACAENGLTPAEAYLGFTRFGAMALNDSTLGQLRVGGPADVVVYRCASYRTLPYHFGINEVARVIKAGREV